MPRWPTNLPQQITVTYSCGHKVETMSRDAYRGRQIARKLRENRLICSSCASKLRKQRADEAGLPYHSRKKPKVLDPPPTTAELRAKHLEKLRQIPELRMLLDQRVVPEIDTTYFATLPNGTIAPPPQHLKHGPSVIVAHSCVLYPSKGEYLGRALHEGYLSSRCQHWFTCFWGDAAALRHDPKSCLDIVANAGPWPGWEARKMKHCQILTHEEASPWPRIETAAWDQSELDLWSAVAGYMGGTTCGPITDPMGL